MARSKITPNAPLWFDNEELALYVVAKLALGKEPVLPINDEALAIHRRLRTAIQTGKLKATRADDGPPNVLTTVTRGDLRKYATERRDDILLRLCDQWDSRQQRSPNLPVKIRAAVGRRPENDWDAFWREVVRIANVNGLPDTLSDLTKQMVSWASSSWLNPPDNKHIRTKLHALYSPTRAAHHRPKTESD